MPLSLGVHAPLPLLHGPCEALESRTGSESARLTIPRLLVALYDVRNRRGVGHVSGDVSANHMDAELVLAMSK